MRPLTWIAGTNSFQSFLRKKRYREQNEIYTRQIKCERQSEHQHENICFCEWLQIFEQTRDRKPQKISLFATVVYDLFCLNPEMTGNGGGKKKENEMKNNKNPPFGKFGGCCHVYRAVTRRLDVIQESKGEVPTIRGI